MICPLLVHVNECRKSISLVSCSHSSVPTLCPLRHAIHTTPCISTSIHGLIPLCTGYVILCKADWRRLPCIAVPCPALFTSLAYTLFLLPVVQPFDISQGLRLTSNLCNEGEFSIICLYIVVTECYHLTHMSLFYLTDTLIIITIPFSPLVKKAFGSKMWELFTGENSCLEISKLPLDFK